MDARRIVLQALKEDAAFRDVTSRALFEGRNVRAEGAVIAKQAGVICGVNLAEQCFRALDGASVVRKHLQDGARVRPGQKVLSVSGKAPRLLAAERTALNF